MNLKFYKIFILAIFHILLFAGISTGKDIYVDQAYTGQADGSLISPYQTIQEAINTAVSGDFIRIRKGIYRETAIIKVNGITVMPYDNEEVIISGTDPLFQWAKVTESVFKTVMKWNVTESDQSNQIFVNGEMMNLVRWPRNIGTLVLPSNAYADKVAIEGGNTVIYDADFIESAGVWDGCEIWINLSRSINNNGWDGQGFTGKVLSTGSGRIVVSGLVSGGRIGDEPWGMGPNMEYFLFNPLEAAVTLKGGIGNYLKPNEWWKKGDTLFVRTANGNAPAENDALPNLVEVKKRLYGFAIEDKNKILIKDFDLFACSINTDYLQFFNKTDVAPAYNITIDGINAKYVTHFTNQAKDYQMQWVQRSGFIISGTNITLKNSTIQFSAGSGISILGRKNKILNCLITDCNYSNAECGVINTGLVWNPGKSISEDHEIAYNTIRNTPQQGINIRSVSNSDPSTPGTARIHHNIISDFMLKTHDSGGFDNFGLDGKYLRVDHNVLSNATNFLAIGFYLDFGLRYIVDHNLMWNIDRPIQLNYKNDLPNGILLVYNNTVLSDKLPKPGILNGAGAGSLGPDFNIQNNISTGQLSESTFTPVVLSNFSPQNEDELINFFTDYKNDDYTLKSSFDAGIDQGEFLPFVDSIVGDRPDLGCYEYGIPEWNAGAGQLTPEFAISDSAFFLNTSYKSESSWTFPVTVLPYSGFDGEVNLSLGALPEGISAFLPVDKINPNDKFLLTINAANTLKVGKHHFNLYGKAGTLHNTRTYVVEVPQKISSIKILEADTAILYGKTLQIHTVANDQQGNPMRVQPLFSYTVSGGGQINNKGKYAANKISENVNVIVKYKELTDTLHLKVLVANSISNEIDNTEEKLNVFPNPADDNILVTFYSSGKGKKSFSICNTQSLKLIKSETLINEGENQIDINTSAFPAGMYFFIIENSNKKIARKFIINH
jgi:hypothetical protein